MSLLEELVLHKDPRISDIISIMNRTKKKRIYNKCLKKLIRYTSKNECMIKAGKLVIMSPSIYKAYEEFIEEAKKKVEEIKREKEQAQGETA